MRSGNPTLNEKTFQGLRVIEGGGNAMTVQGTAYAAGILLLLLVTAAGFSWYEIFVKANTALAVPLGMGGAIGGFVVAIITAFKKKWAPFLAPVYAVLEGLFLGMASAIAELSYPGIAMQAVGLTFGTAFALFFAYTSRIIKVTDKFRMGVFAATGGIALVYLASFVLGLFGIQVPFLHDSGPIGIGISVVIVIVAALNLVLDFDFIERAAAQGVPKYMQWYGAFALMVTLAWLYLEILRLLMKLRNR